MQFQILPIVVSSKFYPKRVSCLTISSISVSFKQRMELPSESGSPDSDGSLT